MLCSTSHSTRRSRGGVGMMRAVSGTVTVLRCTCLVPYCGGLSTVKLMLPPTTPLKFQAAGLTWRRQRQRRGNTARTRVVCARRRAASGTRSMPPRAVRARARTQARTHTRTST
jgi:hypothetical protein